MCVYAMHTYVSYIFFLSIIHCTNLKLFFIGGKVFQAEGKACATMAWQKKAYRVHRIEQASRGRTVQGREERAAWSWRGRKGRSHGTLEVMVMSLLVTWTFGGSWHGKQLEGFKQGEYMVVYILADWSGFRVARELEGS